MLYRAPRSAIWVEQASISFALTGRGISTKFISSFFRSASNIGAQFRLVSWMEEQLLTRHGPRVYAGGLHPDSAFGYILTTLLSPIQGAKHHHAHDTACLNRFGKDTGPARPSGFPDRGPCLRLQQSKVPVQVSSELSLLAPSNAAIFGKTAILRSPLRIPEHPATHSDNIRPLIPEYPATCDALP